MQKIGVFGGTFNPIHYGHLNIAKEFINRLSLDKLLLIPTNIPPHKNSSDLATAQQRLEMCQLAVQEEEKILVSDIELNREGKSYTVYTLRELKRIYPESEIYCITGADMFLTLHTWRNFKELLTLAIMCAAPRDETNAKQLELYAEKIQKVGGRTAVENISLMNVSSTMIRNSLHENNNVDEYLPKQVREYILKNGIYQGEN